MISGTPAARGTYGDPVKPKPLALLQGTVDLLILRSIERDAAHGYAIARWVREQTDGVLGIEDAALYQALHRLEAKRWIEASWGVSENNRKAKFYSITPAGRKQLAAEADSWARLSGVIGRLLRLANERGTP